MHLFKNTLQRGGFWKHPLLYSPLRLEWWMKMEVFGNNYVTVLDSSKSLHTTIKCGTIFNHYCFFVWMRKNDSKMKRADQSRIFLKLMENKLWNKNGFFSSKSLVFTTRIPWSYYSLFWCRMQIRFYLQSNLKWVSCCYNTCKTLHSETKTIKLVYCLKYKRK